MLCYNITVRPRKVRWAMTPPPTRPRPCTDPLGGGRHVPYERIALATAICRERGVQMTELRRGILELLWARREPASTYQLMEVLKRRDSRPVGPPTVYRALAFLMAQGLVSKIETLNAYLSVRPSRARPRLHVLHLPRLPGVSRVRGPADRNTAGRACCRLGVCRDKPHGRGRGQVRAVRGSRRGVAGYRGLHPWRARLPNGPSPRHRSGSSGCRAA